ncbi:MAG: hypothetical protein ACK4NC_05430 [Candidatus Gracilibacteria bacterium]
MDNSKLEKEYFKLELEKYKADNAFLDTQLTSLKKMGYDLNTLENAEEAELSEDLLQEL